MRVKGQVTVKRSADLSCDEELKTFSIVACVPAKKPKNLLFASSLKRIQSVKYN